MQEADFEKEADDGPEEPQPLLDARAETGLPVHDE